MMENLASNQIDTCLSTYQSDKKQPEFQNDYISLKQIQQHKIEDQSYLVISIKTLSHDFFLIELINKNILNFEPKRSMSYSRVKIFSFTNISVPIAQISIDAGDQYITSSLKKNIFVLQQNCSIKIYKYQSNKFKQLKVLKSIYWCNYNFFDLHSKGAGFGFKSYINGDIQLIDVKSNHQVNKRKFFTDYIGNLTKLKKQNQYLFQDENGKQIQILHIKFRQSDYVVKIIKKIKQPLFTSLLKQGNYGLKHQNFLQNNCYAHYLPIEYSLNNQLQILAKNDFKYLTNQQNLESVYSQISIKPEQWTINTPRKPTKAFPKVERDDQMTIVTFETEQYINKFELLFYF